MAGWPAGWRWKRSTGSFTKAGAAPGQDSLRQGVENANFEVFKTSQQLDAGRMGTTLTAGFIDGSTLFLAHVGDSRAYLVRGRQAACLTNDHTTVGDLVRARVIGPDKVRTHPHRSVLTRSVGLSHVRQAGPGAGAPAGGRPPGAVQRRGVVGDAG